MSIVLYSSRRIRPLAVLLLAAGFCAGAAAQIAPSLLPYTVKLLAGGGGAIAAGATCPVSGLTATDAFGDGCLATEISLSGPRFAVMDKIGAIFFSDYTNGLIRRIDPVTGIITVVLAGIILFSHTGQIGLYRTPLGEVILTIILAVFVLLLIWAKAQARRKPDARIILTADPSRVGES